MEEVALDLTDTDDATAEAPVVHGAAELPVIGILVEYFDSLQVGCPVKAPTAKSCPFTTARPTYQIDI